MSSAEEIEHSLADELADAERKAWDSLARYKFWMFGYWAAMWVHFNRLSGKRNPSPFRELVKFAKEKSLQESGT